MTGVATLTLWQPWASLIPAGAKTIETRGYRTWHRGRLLIHASSVPQPEEPAIVALPAFHDALWPALGFKHRPMPATVSEALPRGRIVGSAELVDCCPIVDAYAKWPEAERLLVHDRICSPPRVWDVQRSEHSSDMSDHGQLPYGDFTPGRWGWMLADAKPTTERCPWCWGTGAVDQARCGDGLHRHVGACFICPVCDAVGIGDGASRCDPIPARGMPGLWRWSP